MATTTSVQELPKALKCKTWVLKVSIHCQGCKRKVRKVLQGIDGVYTTSIDSQQQRVTVTGNIEAGTLIKKLMKTGKHAEIWPEKVAKKEKESGKANDQNRNDSGSKKSVRFSLEGLGEETKKGKKLPENPAAGKELPGGNNKGGMIGGGGADGACKKKKKKGQKGNDGSNVLGASGSPSSGSSVNSGYQTHGVEMNQVVGPNELNPTRQHSIPWPLGYSIPQVYASSSNMAYPYGSPAPFTYHVAPTPYTHANQKTQMDSFNIFSDENANGCSIM
ncbi:hypothetical protein OIU84_018492 [Salix udensis]|uniref:HMA domain-containing protein n=1 Tax=Salix udensis TaxID=889485 RepID=A0AAD6PHX6_9ROSI|nr:hypothetical protein OIU84_018492 [Salix udensis]